MPLTPEDEEDIREIIRMAIVSDALEEIETMVCQSEQEIATTTIPGWAEHLSEKMDLCRRVFREMTGREMRR